MAKEKLFAVDVEITIKETLFVPARRPGGAAQKALSEEGWKNAVRYHDDIDLMMQRRNAHVTRVRAVEP